MKYEPLTEFGREVLAKRQERSLNMCDYVMTILRQNNDKILHVTDESDIVDVGEKKDADGNLCVVRRYGDRRTITIVLDRSNG